MLSGPHTTEQNGTSQCTTESSREPGESISNKSLSNDAEYTISRCTNSLNTLQCLRELPYAALYSIANEGLEWFATVDGSFITQYPQINYREGTLAQVPILLGTNTDEGTSFGTTGTNTVEDCINELTSTCCV